MLFLGFSHCPSLPHSIVSFTHWYFSPRRSQDTTEQAAAAGAWWGRRRRSRTCVRPEHNKRPKDGRRPESGPEAGVREFDGQWSVMAIELGSGRRLKSGWKWTSRRRRCSSSLRCESAAGDLVAVGVARRIRMRALGEIGWGESGLLCNADTQPCCIELDWLTLDGGRVGDWAHPWSGTVVAVGGTMEPSAGARRVRSRQRWPNLTSLVRMICVPTYRCCKESLAMLLIEHFLIEPCMDGHIRLN
jgi:hypothetical protein